MSKAALNHLRHDPIMAQLVEQYDLPIQRTPEQINVFIDLVESILSQQLSTKVAAIITGRVYELIPQHQVTPTTVLALDQETVRACGVSYAKIRYIRSAAEASLSGAVDFEALTEMSDREVVEALVQITGVGQWTAEMMLIFSLYRPDVFSVGDLGLREAVSRLYGLDREDRPAIIKLAETWAPYRSLASRYLWKSLDNKVETK